MPELLSAVKAGPIVMVATNRHIPIIGIVHSSGTMPVLFVRSTPSSQKQHYSLRQQSAHNLSFEAAHNNTNPLISFHSTGLFVPKNDFDCSSFLILLTSIGELLANLQKLNELCKRVIKIKNMGLTGRAP